MLKKSEYLKSDKILKPPLNINLPYFAYGLFKPDQLAYNKIKNLTKKHHSGKIYAEIYLKDGIVLLKPKTCKSLINGELYYFKEDMKNLAYDNIRAFEPKKFYKWLEIKVIINGNLVKANTLIGKDFKNSKLLKNPNFQSEDPFFKEALYEIESIIKEDNINQEKLEWINTTNFQHIFRLQMAYSLLWTCIKRFAFIKYPLTDDLSNQYKLIAKEPVFKENLLKTVKTERKIYSSDYLNENILNKNSPEESLNYYYTLRNYGVHRETISEDYIIIKTGLQELLKIFKEIVENSKKENINEK